MPGCLYDFQEYLVHSWPLSILRAESHLPKVRSTMANCLPHRASFRATARPDQNLDSEFAELFEAHLHATKPLTTMNRQYLGFEAAHKTSECRFGPSTKRYAWYCFRMLRGIAPTRRMAHLKKLDNFLCLILWLAMARAPMHIASP